MVFLANCPGFSLAPEPALNAEELAAVSRFVPYSAKDALQAASSLRAEGFSPEQVSAILSQAKVQTRASAKFGADASSMLFTEAGFEQATRLAVAKLHAQRYQDAALTSVADLGCGIGADSRAFARAGLATVSVELDSATASFAAYNLKSFDSSVVYCGDLEQVSLENLCDSSGTPVQSLWLDPARREVSGGKTNSRIFDPEGFAPPFSFVLKLAETGIPMGVKMGPGIPHEAIPENCEAQWVSHGGSVVEVVLWFNALASEGVRRSATLLSSNPLEPEILAELSSPSMEGDPAPVGDLASYLYEPDGAVVRSHLVAELAQDLGAHLLDEKIAYLTSDQLVATSAASAYRVLDTMPINEKALKKWVREQGISTLTIKKRGVDIVPEQLRAKLLAGAKKKKGGNEATLVLTRLGQGSESQRLALWVEPLS